MEAAELLQAITWLGFVLLLSMTVAVMAHEKNARRFYVMPVLMYALAGLAYYTIIIFFRDVTTPEDRLMGSVVLRLLSIFMAATALAIPLRSRWLQ